MPAPSTGRELHVDVPLSNFVVNRRPEGFIADRLLPVTNVSKQSDLYYKYNEAEWRAYEAGLTLRAPGTQAKKVHFTVSSDTYFAKNYALGTDWPVEDEVNADSVLQWAQSSALYLMDRLMMDYEFRVAQIAVASANVATIFVPSSGWNSAARTAYTDLLTWKEGFRQITGKVPNTLIVPEPVMNKLRVNDQLRDILYGDNGGQVEAGQLGTLLGISNVLVPTVQVNTAAEDAAGTRADVWAGNGNIWMAHLNTAAGFMTDTWMNAFRWTSPALGVPMSVQRFPFDPKRKVYEIEVGYYQDEKVVSNDLAIRVSSLTAT